DQDARRAAALANAYVTNLDQLVAELSTSAAHRERIFLEERLISVKQGLEASEKEFSQFASKNHAINITEQGKAMVEAAATLQGQLIAAEAELEGLRQLYTENNARVRTIKARVDEIRHQLDKIGGKGEETEPSSKGNDPLYPSLRQLPLLGVTYADLYRQMKIQEAVFETLTQQDELAKVEEAKETPSVKVLDPAEIPEQKSFPPRLMILIYGVIISIVFGMVWVGVNARWAALDPDDPGRLLALEVTSSVKARMLGASENGNGLHAFARKAWRKFGGEADASDERRDRP
ncbi:MAG: GNVR domain-containing protein, partial [Candidatus Sulfotelmatobacter sp.]